MSTIRRLRIASYGNNVGVQDMKSFEQYTDYKKYNRLKPYKYQQQNEDDWQKKVQNFNHSYMQLRNKQLQNKIQPLDSQAAQSTNKSNYNDIKHIFETKVPREEDRHFVLSLRNNEKIQNKRELRSHTQYIPTRVTENVDYSQKYYKTIIDVKPRKLESLSSYDHVARNRRRGISRDQYTVNYITNLRNYNRQIDLEKSFQTIPKRIIKKGDLEFHNTQQIPLNIDVQKYEQMMGDKNSKLNLMKTQTIQKNYDFYKSFNK